jgi:tRNA(fMet)-specific endonuclease VapC
MKDGNSCLLDTNIIILLFNGDDEIAKKLDGQSDIFIPSIVVGELYFGAYRSTAKTKNLNRIETFLVRCTILQADKITGNFYGSVKAALMEKGKPIPENDIWISAIALQHQLPLITKDNHFRYVEGLKKIKW